MIVPRNEMKAVLCNVLDYLGVDRKRLAALG